MGVVMRGHRTCFPPQGQHISAWIDGPTDAHVDAWSQRQLYERWIDFDEDPTAEPRRWTAGTWLVLEDPETGQIAEAWVSYYGEFWGDDPDRDLGEFPFFGEACLLSFDGSLTSTA